jgi:hypothetical protein
MERSLLGNISIRAADPHFAIFHAKPRMHEEEDEAARSLRALRGFVPSCESIWIAASAAVTN